MFASSQDLQLIDTEEPKPHVCPSGFTWHHNKGESKELHLMRLDLILGFPKDWPQGHGGRVLSEAESELLTETATCGSFGRDQSTEMRPYTMADELRIGLAELLRKANMEGDAGLPQGRRPGALPGAHGDGGRRSRRRGRHERTDGRTWTSYRLPGEGLGHPGRGTVELGVRQG